MNNFYEYWVNFESWRDFSLEGEHDVEDAHDRYEKRWMIKENERKAKVGSFPFAFFFYAHGCRSSYCSVNKLLVLRHLIQQLFLWKHALTGPIWNGVPSLPERCLIDILASRWVA